MIKSNLDFSLKLFFILLPFCYIIGPAAININIFILFLNFLLLKVIEKKFNLLNFIKRKEVFIFLLFYIYINLLSFLSDDIIFSLKSTIPFIKFLFLILIINYLISNNLFKIKVILLFFSSIFLFILIDSLVQFFFGYNLLFFKSIYNQYTGIFRDEQILGSYVSRYLPIFIASTYFLKIKENYKIILLFLILITSLFIILLSGERTAIMNYFLMCFLFFCFRSIKINVFNLTIFVALFITVIVAIFNNNYLHDRYIKTNIAEFKTSSILNIYIPLPDHYLMHYITAYKIFIDNPIIGSGPNMFRFNCKKDEYIARAVDYFPVKKKHEHSRTITTEQIRENAEIARITTLDSCSTHPHNLHLQILSELGLIGYLFFIYFFIYLARNYFFKSNKINSYNAPLLIGIMINFFPFLPSGNFFASYFNYFIFLPILFLFAEKNYAR